MVYLTNQPRHSKSPTKGMYSCLFRFLEFASCNPVVELFGMVSFNRWIDLFPFQTATMSEQRAVERMQGGMVAGELSLTRRLSV